MNQSTLSPVGDMQDGCSEENTGYVQTKKRNTIENIILVILRRKFNWIITNNFTYNFPGDK